MSTGSLSASSEIKFKIGLVGEAGVGKSCLLLRWAENSFFENDDKYSIGVDYKEKTVARNDKQIKLLVYDTGGQERFRTVTASFYRGMNGVLVVFDISQRSSFERVTDWLREAKNYTVDAAVVLVGNKLDLQQERQVTEAEAKSLADKESVRYFETSAKDSTNVNDTFLNLVDQICSIKIPKKMSSGGSMKKSDSGRKSSCVII